MSWSVFGHGELIRPSNAWTHGPDAYARSPICRGDHEDCSSYEADGSVSDHCCCTDPCRQAHQNICNGNCCRSIPKYICLMFTPDAGQGTSYNCEPKHVRIFMKDTLDRNAISERSEYRAAFSGVGLVLISIGTPVLGDALYKAAECSWKLEVASLGINEEWEVDHHGEVNCLAPPTIVIPGVDIPSTTPGGTLVSCTGVLTTQPYVLAKVPFKKLWDPPPPMVAHSCGTCTELFPILCVRRNSASGDGPYTFSDFFWNRDEKKWFGEGEAVTQFFEPIEFEGKCYISLSGITAPSLNYASIEVDPDQCSAGMILSATADDGEWIEISARPCSCFSFICGQCRCVCPVLCIIKSTNGIISKSQMAWDPTVGQWGGGSEYIQITQDDDGNCQVTSPDFVKPAAIPNECGGDMSFTLQDPPPIGGPDFVVGWCVGCGGICDDGHCLKACDNVPQVLTAEVAGFGIRVEGTEEVKYPCWDPFTVALALVPIGVSEVAGEWQWKGLTSFVDLEGYAWLFSLSIGCDGNLEWIILDPAGVKEGCGGSDSILIPCGEPWDLKLEYPLDCVCPGQVAGIIEIGITA